MRSRNIVLAGLDILLWIWSGTKLVLDMLGRAIVLDDFSNPQGFVARALTWLFSTPWWTPGLIAAILTTFLILWARPSAGALSPLGDSPKASTITRADMSSTELSFRQGRWWHALWAGWPLYSIHSKRRLEFVDSWAAYFDRQRQTLRRRDGNAVSGVNQFADMSIRDLFFHIHPGHFEASTAATIGRQVTDNFSVGQLRVWGRQIDGITQERRPLAEIPKELWQRARFTYWFLDDDPGNRNVLHVSFEAQAGIAPSQYADLQVNRVEALSIWPNSEPQSAGGHDAQIWEAIAHVAKALKEKNDKECFPAARTAIRQAALDGKVHLRGRKELEPRSQTEFSAVHSDIPPSYWINSTLNALSTSDQCTEYSHSDPETAHSWGPKGIYEKNRYANILVSMREIKRLWP